MPGAAKSRVHARTLTLLPIIEQACLRAAQRSASVVGTAQHLAERGLEHRSKPRYLQCQHEP